MTRNNVLRLCAAALNKLNNSASTVQRLRKIAVSGWCGKLNENELDKKTISATQSLFS